MNKLLIISVLFISNILLSQSKQVPIYIEHNSIIKDTNQVESISYRVPYSNLLFVKVNDNFKTSFTLSIEVYKEDEFISRQIVQPSFSIPNYKETRSNKLYYQGVFEFDLPPDKYNIITLFSIESTNVNYKLPKQEITIKDLDSLDVLPPIVVENNLKDDKFTLANYASKIPFSPKTYNLLIGIPESDINTIDVKILQSDKTIFKQKIKSIGSINLEIVKDGEEVKLITNKSDKYNYFVISDFSHLLFEGKSELVVKYDSVEVNYPLTTLWFGKPRILNNPEYSIKLLNYIENENTVRKLLSFDEEEYYKELSKYWSDNYPVDGTKYNYAMEEYYSRADFAIKHYSSLNSYDGAERDRGKIYILYGVPTSIERNYTEMNEVMEVWKYKKVGRKFVFKDTKGTGEFNLVK